MAVLNNIEKLRGWCHKILPLVYDDSLSYYEVVCKVREKLNEVIDLTSEQNEVIEEMVQEIANWESTTDGKYEDFVVLMTGRYNEFVEQILESEAAFRVTMETLYDTFATNVTNNFNKIKNDIVSDFKTSHEYQVGEYCYYGDNNMFLYRCMYNPGTTMPPHDFNYYSWERVDGAQLYGGIANTIVRDNNTWKLNTMTEINGRFLQIAPVYDNTETYEVGDAVWVNTTIEQIQGWYFVICTTAIVTPEPFNIEHWENKDLATYLIEQYEAFLEEYQRTWGIVQTTGSSTNDAMSQKATTDELEKKANIEALEEGDIEPAKSVLAENFDSKMVLTDNSGYLYRTTGGALEVGEQNRVKKIIGASVPIIQYINHGNFDSGTGWGTEGGVSLSVANNKATITVGANHTQYASIYRGLDLLPNKIVLYHAEITSPKATTFRIQTNSNILNYTIPANKKVVINTIANMSVKTTYIQYYIDRNGTDLAEGDSVILENAGLIDLTDTFGTTVANRLYALEQAQAGTGVAKAKEILVKDYYPYNVNAFTHTKTTGKQNIGFNLFDIRKLADVTGWSKSGDYYTGLANNLYSTYGFDASGVRTFVKIPTNYDGRIQIHFEGYVNTANASCRIRFGYTDGTTSDTDSFATSNSTIIATSAGNKVVNSIGFMYSNQTTMFIKKLCIDCYWDGEKTGEFEDYQEWNYPVEDIELKGILSLDAQDNWVADGDEYLPSGVVNKKYAEDSFTGSEEWYWYSEGANSFWYTNLYGQLSKTPRLNARTSNGLVCAIYVSGANQILRIYIKDNPHISSTSNMNSILTSSITLLYTCVTEETSADSYTELQNDSNWGTEKWIDTRDVPMPVFSTCEYIPDLKAKLETAPESPEEDGDYIMHRENGLNSYSSLASWLNDNGYAPNIVPTSPAEDGTYTLKITIADGVATYSWVLDT